MRIIKLVSLLLLFVNIAIAQNRPVQGYDVLGVAMYCQEFLQAPKMEAMSVLMNTFGDPLPCIRKRIKQGGLKLVQIDLIDATCWRNNKCPAGVPKPDDFRIAIKHLNCPSAHICKPFCCSYCMSGSGSS